MIISLIKDYQIYDAGVDRNIEDLLTRIDIEENDVTLDFCDCGVDYPSTSKILDKVLDNLSVREGKKKLEIQFDFIINEYVLHKWFFVGSEFFKIPEDTKISNDDFKRVITEKLQLHQISLSIKVIKNGETRNELTYGE
jgi:hypothetical protein